MDKLEKAMEKARQQRQAAMGGYSHTRNMDISSIAPQESAAEIIAIADDFLERNRILAHHPRSLEADTFRILRTQVLQIMKKSDFRTLAITSPRYGDGKTTTSLNLALSIAQDLHQTVLLVDLDLRKPTLDRFLGLSQAKGLADYLLRNTPIPECLSKLPFERLSVLPAGEALDNSSEVLASPKMAALAQELKARYHDRLVIYDMPPVLSQDDSIAFLPHVDATLVVVRDGITKTEDLKTCIGRLAGANIIGTVLNNSTQE